MKQEEDKVYWEGDGLNTEISLRKGHVFKSGQDSGRNEAAKTTPLLQGNRFQTGGNSRCKGLEAGACSGVLKNRESQFSWNGVSR